MAMDELHRFLVEQWDSAWEGEGWFGSWTQALGDITAMQAAWTEDDQHHSIWQNVNHVIFWRGVTLNEVEGKARPASDEVARRNFEEPQEISEDAWGETKELLQDSTRAIRSIYAGERPGLERAKYHLTHDAHHLGKIMMLRALQGMKPIV